MNFEQCLRWLHDHGYVGVEWPTIRQLGCVCPVRREYVEDALRNLEAPTSTYAMWPKDRQYRVEEKASSQGDVCAFVYEVNRTWRCEPPEHLDVGNRQDCCDTPEHLCVGVTGVGIEADRMRREALSRGANNDQ